MRFYSLWALWLVLLAPLVILLQLAQEKLRRSRIEKAGDPELMRRLSLAGRDDGKSMRWTQGILLSLAIVLVAVALARPQYGSHTEVRRLRGMDVVFALDLSRSMLAKDATPSRLERAKIELNLLLDQLTGDRVGLVGYTSVALPLAPLTVDHAAVKLQLEGAAPDDLPRGGTSLSAAINTSRELLERSRTEGADQAIIVITDGEEHEGDPEKAAATALDAGIEVHVVGVGSTTGEPIPIQKDGKGAYLKDKNGRTVVSRLNAELVTAVAAAAGGIAALPGPQGGLNLDPVRRRLATLKKAEREDRVVRIYEEQYAWPLGGALFLLLLATVLRPTRRRIAGLALVLFFGTNTAQAQPLTSEDPDVAEGRRALADGQADDAAEAFARARKRLGDRPEILFNQGLADRARGEIDAAVSNFQAAVNAAEDPALRSSSAFALGNSLRQLKKWDEAIDAYKQSLIANPKQTGARRNLEVTQRMKAVAQAQPQDPNQEKEPGDEPPPDSDGGTPDGGGDGGAEGDGGEPPDAGASDGSNGDGGDGGSDNKGQDGSTSPDAGAGDNGASPEGGKDAGQQDAGASPPPPSEPAEEDEPEDEPDADKILDALEAQEKALQRKKQLEKFGRRRVEKDW